MVDKTKFIVFRKARLSLLGGHLEQQKIKNEFKVLLILFFQEKN